MLFNVYIEDEAYENQTKEQVICLLGRFTFNSLIDDYKVVVSKENNDIFISANRG